MDAAHPRHHELDLYRSVAIWAVVFGHWFVVAVTATDGGLDGTNAVGELWWAPPVTWMLQVMPVFFAVGGYANALSFSRHRADGGDALAWMLRRFRRLLVPAGALLAVLVTVVVGATWAGADAELVGTGAWIATVPLWFLAVYAAAVVLTPLAVAADRRFGLVAPVLLTAWVIATDVARFGADNPGPAEGNYLVAWLAVHQLGVAWSANRFGHDARRAALGAAVAIAGALVLVWAGPYPTLMVSAPGEVANTEPPTLALVVFAAGQVGLLVALRSSARRWLAGSARSRAIVTRVQSVVLTLFLWHMAAAVVAILVLYATGLVPTEPVGSTAWLLWRVPWMLTCGAVLGVLTLAFGRIDRHVQQPFALRQVRWPVAGALGVVGIVGCLLGAQGIALAGSGSHGPLGLPSWPVVGFLGGLGLVLIAGQSRSKE